MDRFKNILLLAQEQIENDFAFPLAFDLAKRNNAQLKILGTEDPLPDYARMLGPDSIVDQIESNASKAFEARLHAAVNEHGDGQDIAVTVIMGQTAITIIQEVLRNKHDLIIKTANASSWLEEAFFGSIDLRLLRKCPCPVWLLENTKSSKVKRVVAAIDASTERDEELQLNKNILEISSSLVEMFGAKGELLYCYGQVDSALIQSKMSHEEYAQYLASCQESASEKLKDILKDHKVSSLTPHALKGEPQYAVPKFIKDGLDTLLVMGTVARTGIPGFVIGNTAERILSQISCGVLALKPADFVSPVQVND